MPNTDDIYQVLDKGLYKLQPGGGGSNAPYFNPENPDYNASGILPGTLENIGVQNKSKTYDAIVSAGGGADFTTIEAAVAHVTTLGGGSINVLAGTYAPLASIPITTPMKIIGENSSLVTINFSSASRQFAITSSNIYTTGTITSISGGVNVTGSGTSWLANVSAGYQIFLGTRWYTIAAVTGDTTLVLAEGYGDTLTMPGLTYRIARLTTGIEFSGLMIKNSTTTAIAVTDCRQLVFNDLTLIANNVGFSLTNVSQWLNQITVVAASTSDGYQLTNVGLCNVYSLASVGNGGNGATLSNIKTIPFLFSAVNTNTGDGANLTNVVNCIFAFEASANGGQGMEFVSGCNGNFIDSFLIAGNTSDGIKLTATCDNNIIGPGQLTGNGGYGINIAASTCDNNIILAPYYASNSSGTLNDSGTGTQIIQSTTNGRSLLTVPTTDGYASGPTTSSFVSGYTSSAVGDLVYLDSSAKWQKTDADAAATASNMLGIALAVAATDAALLVALPGSFVYSTAFPTLTIGAPYYVGETPGAIQGTIPTGADNVIRVVGFGVHADKLFFMPSSDNQTTVA